MIAGNLGPMNIAGTPKMVAPCAMQLGVPTDAHQRSSLAVAFSQI